MAYGKQINRNPSLPTAPIIGGGNPQQQMAEAQTKAAMFQNRVNALNLAIQATPASEQAWKDMEERDSAIFNRALSYEQFILKGREALTFTKDEKKDETV